jgi:uncharacterized protein (TIGR03000 family)
MRNTSARIAVDVPEDARVTINGRVTTTPGSRREYMSRGLVPGYRYTYQVRAYVNRNGRELSDVKTVHLTAGSTANVAFDLEAAPGSTGNPRIALR